MNSFALDQSVRTKEMMEARVDAASPMPEIQYVSDESGEPTAVIVPIELGREIESEKETAYLFWLNITFLFSIIPPTICVRRSACETTDSR